MGKDETPPATTVGVSAVEVGKYLRAYQRATVDASGMARAAVAVVLRDGARGAEFIVIHRAHRPGDPWSGHMALPGGRAHPNDRDLFMTAARETHEEVGVDLAQQGELLGYLDDLRAIGSGRPLNLVITPLVCTVTGSVTLTPDPREVQSAFWVPLASLRRHEARGTFRSMVHGHALEHPAFIYAGHTIWGLTHRILTGLLDIVHPQ